MTKWNLTPGIFSKTPSRFVLAGLALAFSQATFAATAPESVSFSHKDWDLICDNTLTCRAAGYSTDDTDPAATVLLTRLAGQSTPVINRVMLADYDGEAAAKNPGIPQLLIDNRSQGELTPADGDSWEMNAKQYAAFMQALRRDSHISFQDNIADFLFSGAGSSAVLLKMDDVQGRIDTPSAIIKKGNKPESGVKQPVPVPVIVKAAVRDKESREMTAQEAATIKPALIKLLATGDEEQGCDEEQLKNAWRIAALNEKQSLVSASCWFGAYQGANVYFVISNDMAEQPVMVSDSANYYSNGELSSSMKGRGLGDCWSREESVWDGQRFVQSNVSDTGRCRMIRAGGSWDLPTVVTRVVGQK